MRKALEKYRWILLIIVLHFALGTIYSVVVPVWEAYDEWGHYPYVRYIATHGALPPRDRPLVAQNDTARVHPPLYYMLGAAATFWIDTSDWHDPVENVYSNQHLPSGMGGYNRALHGRDEDFPWRGWVLAVHVARLVSVLLSTITVWLTYRIARLLFPDRSEIYLGATAICAFWPQFLFIGAVVNNDNLMATFGSLVMLLMVKSVVGEPGWRDRAGLVLAQAGAIASKIVGVAFLPVTVWGLLWSFRGARVRRNRRTIGRILLVTLVSAGLFFAIFLSMHPLYYSRFFRYLAVPKLAPDRTLSEWLELVWSVWESLWAYFGWQSVRAAGWAYDVIEPVWLLALAGLVWFFARSRDRAVKRALVGLLSAVVFVAAMTFFRALSSTYYFTGRYLLSTIAAISTLLAVGLGSIGPRRWSRVILGVVSVGMAAFALYVPFASIMPVYARPANLSPQAIAEIPNAIHASFDGKIELIGYEVNPTAFRPGDEVEVSLYWRALAEMDENYTLAIKLIGRDEKQIAKLNVHPGRGSYPTTAWRNGDVVKDTYRLSVDESAEPLALARLSVAFFRERDELADLPVYDESGQPAGDAVFVGRFKVAPVREETHNPQHLEKFALGEAIWLIGYDAPDEIRAGQPLSLTLYWEAKGTPEESYTVFVHVVDDQGALVAQTDGQPADGAYPTDLWAAGEVIVDRHVVVLPDDLAAGSCQIQVGLYSADSGQRLPVRDGNGQVVPDGVIRLGAVSIGE